MAQVHVVKRFNPNYKTWVETAKEEKEKQAKNAKEEAKKIAEEIDRENKEDLDERKMSLRVDAKKIENILKKKGHILRIGYSGSFYVLDNFIWVCGNLLCETDTRKNYYCPAMVVSEDGGNNYKLLRVFKEFGRDGNALCSSSILFLEKNTGYLSVYTMDGYFITYKTSDGGYNWSAILSTKNTPLVGLYVKKIRVVGQNIHLVVSFQKEGSLDLIESNNHGKSWTYKRGNEEVVKTSNGGLTWQSVKKK